MHFTEKDDAGRIYDVRIDSGIVGIQYLYLNEVTYTSK